MRDDADFSAYAVARWTALVRALLLLGSPPDEAHEVARTALARLRSDWRHRDELGDLDDHTAETLLECRARVAGRDTRSAVVLQALLDVLGPATEAEAEAVRLDAEELVVEPLDLDRVVLLDEQHRRAQRRRTTRTVLAALAVVAVAAGVWAWWATRPEPPPGLSDVPVEKVDNPVSVGWYADRRLQLDGVALRIDDVRSFVQVPQGAVYADSAGRVILAEKDGERTLLGTQAPDGSFDASAQSGLVAWVDPGGADELRVYDLGEREEVASQEVGERTRVLAIDDDQVYVTGPDGTFAFESATGWTALARVASDGLLDVAGEARVYAYGSRGLLLTHGEAEVGLARPGAGAQLSPDGDYVLTRTDDGGEGGTVHIYDTLAGQEIDTGLAPGARVYAAKLGGGVATYFVELEQDDPDDGPRLSSSGSLQLVTCPLVDPGLAATCTVHRTFPRSSAWALEQ